MKENTSFTAPEMVEVLYRLNDKDNEESETSKPQVELTINSIYIESGLYSQPIKDAFQLYKRSYQYAYGRVIRAYSNKENICTTDVPEAVNNNMIQQSVWVKIAAPKERECCLGDIPYAVKASYSDLSKAWISNFEAIAAEKAIIRLSAVKSNTNAEVLAAYGCNSNMEKWSPFHGAYYAVIEAVAKMITLGGDDNSLRLTLQENYDKLGKDPIKCGKPFSALLGAYYAQNQLQITELASMDNIAVTFGYINMHVSFCAIAVNAIDSDKIISQKFKNIGSNIVFLQATKKSDGLLDIEKLLNNFKKVKELADKSLILSSCTVGYGGLAAAISKMCLGSTIGFKFNEYINQKSLFIPQYGGIILEVYSTLDLEETFVDTEYRLLGHTQEKAEIFVNGYTIKIDNVIDAY